MNNLSLLFILADILPSLATAVCILSAFICLGTTALYLIGCTGLFGAEVIGIKQMAFETPPATYQDRRYAVAVAPRFRKLLPVVLLSLFFWVASFAVPTDKKTYYAIAASEAGEEVLNSPTAGKAIKALDAWLDKQLAIQPDAAVPTPVKND